MTIMTAESDARGRVWICTYLPTDVGTGVERFVSLLSKALENTNYDVRTLDSTTLGLPEFMRMRIRPLAAWKLGRDLNGMVMDRDVIVCNGYFAWNSRRRRSIVVYHGTEIGRASSTETVASPLRLLAVRLLNARIDRKAGIGRTVVAVSETTRDEVERNYGLRVSKVIPNGVDLARFHPATDKRAIRERLRLPQDDFLILYVGSTDRRKGYSFLMDEIRPLLNSPQRLVVTTDEPRSEDRVTYVGKVRPDGIAEYYQACDAFIMPSYYEGCSYALAEALACGTPSVVSNTGSAAGMMRDEVLGKYVLTSMDARGYATRIQSLMQEDEWRRVSRASRAYAESVFNFENFKRAYVELIDEVIAQD
jgi:glycosyltransferase involved in cell wall biosynthesis